MPGCTFAVQLFSIQMKVALLILAWGSLYVENELPNAPKSQAVGHNHFARSLTNPFTAVAYQIFTFHHSSKIPVMKQT